MEVCAARNGAFKRHRGRYGVSGPGSGVLGGATGVLSEASIDGGTACARGRQKYMRSKSGGSVPVAVAGSDVSGEGSCSGSGPAELVFIPSLYELKVPKEPFKAALYARSLEEVLAHTKHIQSTVANGRRA